MPEMRTRIINLWAGPSAGKSTTAAGLFFLMKSADIRCELVSEYAKDKTYEEAWGVLRDQFYIAGHQSRRLRRLIGKVDWIISDSPLPLGILYVPYDQDWFKDALWGVHDSFENIEVLLERTKKFQTYGRTQTEDEARAIDERIKLVVGDRIEFTTEGNPQAPQAIFDFIKTHHFDAPMSV